MTSLSDFFQDDFTAHAVDIARFTEHTRRRVIGLIELLIADLRVQIERADLEGVSRESFRLRRMEALLARSEEMIAAAYSSATSALSGVLVEFAKVEAEFLAATSFRAFGVEGVFKVGLTQTEARQLVKSTTVLGGPATDYWQEQASSTKRRFARQIRLGVAAGETNRELVNRLVGKATGRRLSVQDAEGKTRIVREYEGGVLSTSRRDANTLVRTSVQNVSNQTLLATYRQNEDLVKGVQAIVTLDGRTSLICISRSGGAWDLKGAPLPESTVKVRFPGPPPWHFNCRTVIIPITRSWDELLNPDTDRSSVQRLNSVPDGTRASMDGQVAGSLTYPEWLETKPASFQRAVLGSGRYDLWKAGKLDLHQLLDQAGNPMSLEELRRKVRTR